MNRMKKENSDRYIIVTGCSVAQFVEGEFEVMLSTRKNLGSQFRSNQLAEKLAKAIICNNVNLNFCANCALNSICDRNRHSKMFWYSWIVLKISITALLFYFEISI